MNRTAIIVALLALAQPLAAQEPTQVHINADGQITRVVSPEDPAYLRYQYLPVDCVMAPCPNYFVLAADVPYDDGIVIWSGEAAPAIIGSKKVVNALTIQDDGPECWVVRGTFATDDAGAKIHVDEIVGSCT